MQKILWVILIAVVGAAVAFYTITRDGQAPAIALPQEAAVNHDVVATIRDNRALGELCYYLDGKADAKTCIDPGGVPAYELTIDLSTLADGAHEVCVTAADAVPYFANRASQCQSYTLDTVPPRGTLEAATRYMQRGGAAAVFVSTAEPESDLHVKVGERLFRFISNADKTRHFAVFAHPEDVEVADFQPIVEINDLAGNTRRLPVGTVTKERHFNTDTLNVPHSFIERKSLEMLNKEGSGKEAFIEMNRTLRAESRDRIRAVTSAAQSAEPVWQGAFYRNAGAPKAQFADHRTYLLDGENIDQQTHYGLDIAGLAQMPIKAANNGKVLFADNIGIYGNCVILDHGAHVFTLYAHLSQIDVTPDEQVSKGDVIGRSGMTGMAGGDHLHFAMYVADVPVEPTEWFDPAWLQTRINDIYHDFSSGE